LTPAKYSGVVTSLIIDDGEGGTDVGDGSGKGEKEETWAQTELSDVGRNGRTRVKEAQIENHM
jgi:hypothetical protein